MTNKKAPSLRFKGFTDDWEQRKVGELLTERNEQAPMCDEYPLMAFIANEGVAPKGERYDRSSLVNDTAGKLYKKTRFGDFIYSSNNLETGSIGLNKYGNASISPVYSIFEPTGIADSDFIGRRLVRKDFINAMVKWRQGVVYGQWKIHESDFIKIEVAVPSVDEQRQIGMFLDQLDNLITLQQRECERLQIVKKSMLENMFPKNGERVPKIRFSGFTDDWEQRKLGDMAIFNPKADLPDVFEYVDLESVVGTEMLTHRTELKRTAPSRAQRLAQTGDLFYQTVRPYQKNNYLFEKPDKHYVFSTGYAQMRPFDDGRFLLCLVQNDSFVKDVLDNCTGTSYPAINSFDLEKIEVYSPSNPQEQKRIGDFFKDLDSLITLHQRMKNLLVNQ
jgi:type I restriction enzyme S subunit